MTHYELMDGAETVTAEHDSYTSYSQFSLLKALIYSCQSTAKTPPTLQQPPRSSGSGRLQVGGRSSDKPGAKNMLGSVPLNINS